jgi:segregation and condensation protein A
MSGIISAEMNLPATHPSPAYRVTTSVYEGPLDLLLQLIEKTELDITTLALAQVTDQFLEHIRSMQDHAVANEVSTFLVIAARLVQIKSEMLLPRPPVRTPDEEDPGEMLARQLIAYKRFKEIAGLLAQREAAGLRTYLRVAPSPKIDSPFDLSGISMEDLVAAAQQALLMTDDRLSINQVVSAPKISIWEKISLVTHFLRVHGGKISFHQLFSRQVYRLEIVVTFLAVLELIKRRLVEAQQTDLFGEIEIQQTNAWDENTPFELEFGE